jgi:hypothetical protein
VVSRSTACRAGSNAAEHLAGIAPGAAHYHNCWAAPAPPV